MSWRGLLGGALALVALQVAVQSAPANRLAALLELPGRWAVRFLSPDVPAIPERHPEATAVINKPTAAAPSIPRFPVLN